MRPPPPFLFYPDLLFPCFPFVSPSLLWVFHRPLCAPFLPLWVLLYPMWGFGGSLGGLRLFEDNRFLMRLVLSLWQMVWVLHPTWAQPLERFRSKSLMLFPPCLRLDLFKHLIVVCLCARIAWPLMPWFKQLKHPIIRSVEDCFFGLPACHLLIRTTLVANVLIVLLDVCKSLVLDPFMFMYVGFLVFFVALVVVLWAFLCSWFVHVVVILLFF